MDTRGSIDACPRLSVSMYKHAQAPSVGPLTNGNRCKIKSSVMIITIYPHCVITDKASNVQSSKNLEAMQPATLPHTPKIRDRDTEQEEGRANSGRQSRLLRRCQTQKIQSEVIHHAREYFLSLGWLRVSGQTACCVYSRRSWRRSASHAWIMADRLEQAR